MAEVSEGVGSRARGIEDGGGGGVLKCWSLYY